jgi:hypothetical protein
MYIVREITHQLAEVRLLQDEDFLDIGIVKPDMPAEHKTLLAVSC